MIMRSALLSLAAFGFSAALMTGCGFTPVHQSLADGSSLKNVSILTDKGDNVADNQAGFIITQRLRDRIGNGGAAPKYRLEITPDYSRGRLGISDQDVATRYDITVKATYILYDGKSGDILTRGKVSSVSTFGAPTGPYGVITADNVGVDQASQETADKLIRDLARYFARENRSADR